MKRSVFVLALCSQVIRAQGALTGAGNQVAVWVDNEALVPTKVVLAAESMASEAFSAIRVKVAWNAGKPHRSHKTVASGCAPENRPILVKVAAGSGGAAKGEMGVADITHGSITIWYGQIDAMAQVWRGIEHVLLSHVLVHEIGHVLQGFPRHSETGIMKAHWTLADYHAMWEKPLGFTPLDIGLIRSGLAYQMAEFCKTWPDQTTSGVKRL